jgi:hypothetical protein
MGKERAWGKASMIRLHLIVEGQTEELFVRTVLAPHLGAFDVSVDARRVEMSRQRGHIFRGGLIDYGRVARDISRWLKEDQNRDVRFSTMFDLYALPDDFPAFDAARKLNDPYARVEMLEKEFAASIGDMRFIPYIQLHEFEALLFSKPEEFNWEFIEHDRAISNLREISKTFASPELINDNRETAPSKRIISEIPEYAARKASAGPVIAEKIGLPHLQATCPHFDQWLILLESLGSAS